MTVDERSPEVATGGPTRAEPQAADPTAGRRWAWIGLGAAALFGCLIPISPLGALGAIGALIMLTVAVLTPRALVVVTVLAVLFVRPIEHLTSVELLGYLDEGLVAVCAVVLPIKRLFARKPLRRLPGQWWFVGFLTLGVLSGLVNAVPASIYLLGAAVIGKGLVLGWAVTQIDWTERDLRAGARIAVIVILIALAATAVNLAAPAAWNAIMASDGNAVEARSVLPSLIGPFSHPIDLGQFMALSALAITTWRSAVSRGPLSLALLLATAAGALLTARRTAIGSLTVGWLWVKLQVRSAIWVVMLAAVPVILIVLGPTILTVIQVTYHDYWTAGTREARTVLTVDSFDVAASYFPLGAGFGRFGSAVAATNYSPEYLERGYNTIWGLGMTPETGRFLTDTEWPAIIGETGFLGAIAFLIGLYLIFRTARRRWRAPETHPMTRWAGLTTMTWLIACLVQSGATVSFTGPPVYGVLFALIGVMAALPEPPRDDLDGRAGRPGRARRRVGRPT